MGTTPEHGNAPADPGRTEQPSSPALDAEEPTSKEAEQKPGKKPATKRRKKAQAPVAKYVLRSSCSGVRVLRPRPDDGKKEALPPAPAAETSGNGAGRRRKKGKTRAKRGAEDEFGRMRLRVAYYLRRMNYEQSLVDAYASEGWKGLSLEKIRPEKELERAKSEITRCKVKIRDLFQQLDSLLLEGRLDDSLFDLEGQIDSEDIFCAKCGSKDLSTRNDIILCDGVCNRGFHQKCLTPPLLNEDIPSGDEGWLCPGCDCKVECIDLVNEFQGTVLSVEDEWEKIFPEAAASADGKHPYDDLGLPSDDSEDEDFAPDGCKVDGVDDEEEESDSSSSSEDSDFTSEDSDVATNNLPNGDPGLPSDDSEDDDYDPDKLDAENRSVKDGAGSDMASSSSDESDFSSDSEGSGPLCYNNEIESSSLKSPPRPGGAIHNPERRSISAGLLSLKECNLGRDNVVTSLGKRERKTVGCNKNDTDTISASDSDDDDETWTGNVSKKSRHEVTGKGSSREKRGVNKDRCRSSAAVNVPLNPNMNRSVLEVFAKSRTKMCKKSQWNAHHRVGNQDGNLSGDTVNNSYSSTGLDNERLENAIASPSLDSHASSSGLNSAGGSIGRYFGKEVSQKLLESFKENQYPTAQMKRNLAEHLGITYKQVDKWFGNARHSFKAAANSTTTPTRSNPQDTCKKGQNVKSARINGLEQLPPISMVQNEVGSQSSSGIAATDDSASKTLDLKDAISPQTAGEKSRASIDREKLVLRELRKLKRGH